MKLPVFILLFFTAIACVRQTPQLPTNKATTVDSSAIALQLANEKLIQGEDSIVFNYIRTSKIEFKKTSSGLWYKIYEVSKNQEKPKPSETCNISYKVNSFDNALLFNETKNIVIGKKQIINGIEEALLLMNRGDSAVLVVPWYIGYGMKGNENIAPYTSIVVRLQLLK